MAASAKADFIEEVLVDRLIPVWRLPHPPPQGSLNCPLRGTVSSIQIMSVSGDTPGLPKLNNHTKSFENMFAFLTHPRPNEKQHDRRTVPLLSQWVSTGPSS